jgi:hypothetical protein
LGGPPERSIQALFAWFDTDGDNMLSRREFVELSRFVDERRPGRPDGPAGPDRVGRRGPLPRPADGDRERLERALRDETRRRDDRAERRPDRPDRPRRPGPDAPPGPPTPSEPNRPDPI